MLKVSFRLYLSIIAFGLIWSATNPAFAQTRLTKEPRPDWIDNPTPGYYIGVSHRFAEEADSRSDALNNAKRQIIESLGGIIESEFIDRIIESSGQVESQDAFTDSRIKVVSKNIVSVNPEKTFVEQWQEGKGRKKKIVCQAYVAVYFDEEAHRAFMRQLLNETCLTGETQLKSALVLATQGHIFLAIDQIKSAEQHLQPLTEITGLAPADLSAIKQLSEQMLNRVVGLQNGVRIENRGDKQTTKWGSALPQPLKIDVFWQDESGRYPIPGRPVEFTLLSGKALFNPNGQTDEHGQAFCAVKEIGTAGKVEIEARVTFPEGYQIAQNSTRFTLLPDNKVLVRAVEINLGSPVAIPALANVLLQKITSAGFSVIENNPFGALSGSQIENLNPAEIQKIAANCGADLILLASISSDQPNRVQDGFYFARARGVLKVYNLTKQTIVANYLIEDKNAGNSPENAGAKAIKKVSDALVQKLTGELGL
ncbi:MAG: hypothetical protein V1681_03520 [Candidatus Neomarinimicrobiota bacterium]